MHENKKSGSRMRRFSARLNCASHTRLFHFSRIVKMTSKVSEKRREQDLVVDVTDGLRVHYTLRGLVAEELDDWYNFCASIFSYKGKHAPPPSYFERHFVNDPYARNDPSLIRVALYENTIVASCRIFLRTISTGGTATGILCGGIGEVCTSPSHRRRGLSKALLLNSLTIMEHNLNVRASLLHAAPAFFPVYQSVGYQGMASRWSNITLTGKGIKQSSAAKTPSDSEYIIRLAQFPHDTQQLHSLHQHFSERRLAGCILRSKDYWEKYISKELEGSLWVWEEKTRKNTDDITESSSILGWLSLRRRGDDWQLREFGCNPQKATCQEVMEALLFHAFQEIMPDQEAIPDSLRLKVPTFLVRQEEKSALFPQEAVVDIESDDDLGWMYRPIGQNGISLPDICQSEGNLQHLIWPSDSF